MMIYTNTATANPLREPVQATQQPSKPAAPAREAALVRDVEKKLEPAPAQAQAALAEINQALKMASIGVQFEFDKEADTMIAKVVDVESGEVIRQIPTEEVVRISKAMDNLQGLLLRQTA